MSTIKVDNITGRLDDTTINQPITFSANTATLNSGVVFPTGHVLQVKIVEDATAQTVNSTTYADTNLVLAITPGSASNKILAQWTVQADSGGNWGLSSKLIRTISSTSTAVYTSNSLYDIGFSAGRIRGSMNHLDSPNTTNEITYKVQLASYNSIAIYANDLNSQTQLILWEIAA